MRLLVFIFFPVIAYTQSFRQPDAAEIKLKLKKLNFLGSVLYVAAHPDDENTRVITYFGNDRLAATGYLSMTRGDGGQNLIGSEIRDELGLIRTQELLAARKIDGASQFFTRANDFGFSKSADETFKIWGKEEILSDVVRIYRQYQPDIIITRFPPDERAGHGHHTASALLAQEAFDRAANAEDFSDQLTSLSAWQPKRVFTNTGRWWNQSINENTPGVTTLNVGGYSSLLGASYTEIAAVSRSQHKSQGFGSRGTRGDQLEFLELAKGEKPEKDVFEGVNTTWSRVKGGERIQPLVTKAIETFDEENPAALLPLLLQLRNQIKSVEPGVWRNRKLEEVNGLIRACLGLHIEAVADHYWASPGKAIAVTMEIVNRSPQDVIIEKISSTPIQYDTTLSTPLKNNKLLQLKIKRVVLASEKFSDPYWLQQPHSLGLFTVEETTNIGKPELDSPLQVVCSVTIFGESLQLSIPIIHRTVDPVKGELIRVVEIVPPVVVNTTEPTLIFGDNEPKEVKLIVKSTTDGLAQGKLTLKLPPDWRCEPLMQTVELTKRGEEQTRIFTVYPSTKENTIIVDAAVEVDGKTYSQSLKNIAYDHIPIQTLLPNAQIKMVRVNLKKEGSVIGYIKGAGDDIPTALRNIGYQVWEMKNEEITPDNLKRVDAVVLGIRAINTNDRLRFVMTHLLDYVKNGGTMVVQYNTNFDLETETFSPYPITLSRDRVTEEDSKVTITKPDHTIFNYPNKITDKDFEGWVQERGLYFPNKWDANYEAVLSMNDKGESGKEGSLLVTNYGEGHYIYTGLSFFRQLPEGVPGAYRLFANLMSAGAQKKIPPVKNKNRLK